MSWTGLAVPDNSGRGTEYLSLEDLLDLVTSLRTGPVRDLGLLESACYRPQATFLGHEAYPALAAKAAALMHSLVSNHALADGNKRLGLLATTVFLRINDHSLDLTDDQAFDLTMSVAAGQLDVAGIERRLRIARQPLRDVVAPSLAAQGITGPQLATRPARTPHGQRTRAARRSRGTGNSIER